jgi:hypothetical protein
MQSMVTAASGLGVGRGRVEDIGEGRHRGAGRDGSEGGGPQSGASEAVIL